MRLIQCLFVTLLIAGMNPGGLSGETAITSSIAVGGNTPSFVVLDVTGPHKGEAICYVCDYRGAPTILAFFQETGDETAHLIAQLDKLVQQKAEKNLKAVAVVTSGQDAKAWLENLAREKDIKMPLVVFRKGKEDSAVRLYKLNLKARNTFLVSNNREVTANLVDVNEETFTRVADASAKMLGE